MIACAGAGKSTTLAARIAHRIDSGVDPSGIVAITFTRKAAHELKQKLKKLEVGIAYVGTVHAWALGELNSRRQTPLVACPASLFESDIREAIRISGKKISVNQVINATESDGFAWLILQRVRSNNEHRGIIDYDAILKRWLKEVAVGGREVPELFVDEFQDTGWDEFEIYRHAKHLTFVADPRQTLYAFRGADPERINLMAEIRRSQVVTLKQNFRCSPEIDAYAYKANAGDVAGTEASMEQIADEVVKLAPSKITVLCGYNATVDKLKALVSSRGVSVATSRPHAEVVKMEAVLRYLESGSDHLFEHALNLVDPDAYKRSKHQANQSLCSISEIITESEAWSEIGHEAYSLKQAMPDMSYGDLAEMVANQQTSGDVQIMTIHAAKGLEWDNVGFVDEMSSNSHHSRMRYVACTRARSRLIHWRL